MWILRPLILGFASLGVTLALPVPARACTYPPCSFGYAAPARNSIPANAPAVAYRPPQERPNLGFFRYADSEPVPHDRVADPVRAGNFLLRPRRPLAPGRYRLVDFSDCDGSIRTGSKYILDQSFQVTEAVPLPTAIGAVVVRAPVIMPVFPGCVGATRSSAVAILEVRLSPEARAFLEVARFAITIDGKPWLSTDYGAYAREPGFSATVPQGLNERYTTAPYAICGGDPTGQGLTAGRHRGELSMHIAGAETDPPPIAFELDFPDCPADPGAPTYVRVPDAGVDARRPQDARRDSPPSAAMGTAGAGGTGTGGSGGGADPRTMAGPPPQAVGCSVGQGAQGSARAWLVALAIVLLWRRRPRGAGDRGRGRARFPASP